MSEKPTRTPFSKVAGYIKRKYSNEDFNPYLVIQYIYANLLSQGFGHTVSIIGYSDRFQKEIVRAWWHVMSDLGHHDPEKIPPYPQDGRVITHTGTILRFEMFKDEAESHVRFQACCDQSTSVVLCNKYVSPTYRNVIRNQSSQKKVLTFSENNVKKDVDKK